MEVKQIQLCELTEDGFAFLDVTDTHTPDLQGQSLLFDGLAFGICIKGYFRFRINYKEYALKAGEMFVVLPRYLFTCIESAPDASLKMLLVSLDFIRHLPVPIEWEWLRVADLAPCVPLSEDRLKDMEGLYNLIGRYTGNDRRSVQIRHSLTLALLLIAIPLVEQAALESKEQKLSRQETLTRRFFDLLLKHFEEERRVAFYAGQLCVTPKYLSAAVKTVTRYSVQEWIQEAVITQAKSYLRTTDLPVQEISEKLHFLTASSFVRFFRQHTGVTPLEFRKS